MSRALLVLAVSLLLVSGALASAAYVGGELYPSPMSGGRSWLHDATGNGGRLAMAAGPALHRFES